ncbi:Holliday junction resolvase RecU [Crassaminicella profunda]|uniref:Holliday junction resolvase RecU n=1 Tax=Crassaminicella profunda TaxID=1286698 RepID=UPI001CA77198|nr:Holliday junction resolvase RecU [Crassaminicella profunda]QZY56870.1 Holliday junction resolvase RecU [Crassaminicella profunda]
MTTWRSRGHRGDSSENEIDLTNDLYRRKKLAYIKKNPVPIKVIDIDNKGMITKGYFEQKAYVDYSGIAQGISIAFDVKETELKSLPLSNIHVHQIEDLKEHAKQGGVSFILANFKMYNEYYLIPLEILAYYYEKSLQGGRKSIPYGDMDKKFQIKREFNGIINYLPTINTYLSSKQELKRQYIV